MKIPIKLLGQSGVKLTFPSVTVYIDPYLSNSVKLLESSDFERLVPILIKPQEIEDADIVLITHHHLDHCDPHTLPKIAEASQQAKFVGPRTVIRLIEKWGVPKNRLHLASESWVEVAEGLSIMAIPAAHPEIKRDADGNLLAIGYLLRCHTGQLFYFAGDTFVRQELIDLLRGYEKIHTAFLPINEHNFYRQRRGIIGNMSLRDAFDFADEINARNLVPLHWDMFSHNSVYPEEIEILYEKLNPNFRLLLNPSFISLSDANVSVVIRTLNESRYLDKLITAIQRQVLDDIRVEIIVVDSGSTDGTLEIAQAHRTNIITIDKQNFSFGRSLNLGCEAAQGDIIVIVSGHCVPVNEFWLQRICEPIFSGKSDYVYGRQIGGEESNFSEHRIFAKYFSPVSEIPQVGFYCNNANAAISKATWKQYLFDEDLTGLEDMYLAQRLVNNGGCVAYVADAPVFHFHNENSMQIRRRFKREAIALQRIMPQLHVGFFDTIRYIIKSIAKDIYYACCARNLSKIPGIFLYRFNQYIGTYLGNHLHRKLSFIEKEKFFYPE